VIDLASQVWVEAASRQSLGQQLTMVRLGEGLKRQVVQQILPLEIADDVCQK
jgi:hypothetical protein